MGLRGRDNSALALGPGRRSGTVIGGARHGLVLASEGGFGAVAARAQATGSMVRDEAGFEPKSCRLRGWTRPRNLRLCDEIYLVAAEEVSVACRGGEKSALATMRMMRAAGAGLRWGFELRTEQLTSSGGTSVTADGFGGSGGHRSRPVEHDGRHRRTIGATPGAERRYSSGRG